MNLATTKPEDQAFVSDAALYSAGGLDIEQLVARHGGDANAVFDRLALPHIESAVDARLVDMTLTGDLAKTKAQAVLLQSLERMEEALQNPDLGVTTVVRIADTAHKITGMAQVVRDKQPEQCEKFSVNIIFTKPEIVNSKPMGNVVDVAAKESGQ